MLRISGRHDKPSTAGGTESGPAEDPFVPVIASKSPSSVLQVLGYVDLIGLTDRAGSKPNRAAPVQHARGSGRPAASASVPRASLIPYPAPASQTTQPAELVPGQAKKDMTALQAEGDPRTRNTDATPLRRPPTGAIPSGWYNTEEPE